MLHYISGERGIRTPGTSRYDGFQDRCNRPLYHLSNNWMLNRQVGFCCDLFNRLAYLRVQR